MLGETQAAPSSGSRDGGRSERGHHGFQIALGRASHDERDLVSLLNWPGERVGGFEKPIGVDIRCPSHPIRGHEARPEDERGNRYHRDAAPARGSGAGGDAQLCPARSFRAPAQEGATSSGGPLLSAEIDNDSNPPWRAAC